MPVEKAPLHTAMPPTVHVLKPHKSSVLPPVDWALDGKFGHMAFEAGDAGRLVRLAEVLRWLQSSRGLPRTDALKLLCDGLNAEVMGWLYWLQATTWAVPVSHVHTFGYATAEQIAVRKEKDGQQQRQAWLERERQNDRFGTPLTFINGRIRTGYPAPTEPGLPALSKYLQGWWAVSTRRGATCDVLDDLKIRHATTLAIRLDKAHALWRYGRTALPVKDFDMPKIEPPEGWKLHSENGFMRCGTGQADKLVRLHDVVTWLMNTSELPLAAAVENVCSALEKNGPDGVHYLNGDDYARAYDAPSPWDQFAEKKDGASLAKTLRAHWLANPFALEQLVNAPGFEPEYKASKQTPFEFYGGNGSPVAMYAITWPMANKHWRWGAVSEILPLRSVPLADKLPTTWKELVNFRKHHAGAVWSVTQKGLIAVEKLSREAAPGANGIAKAMAGELGITVTRLNDHIRAANEPGKRSNRQVNIA